MFHQGIKGIPYYLGIRSLAEIATREDRVCVLNIAGGESRQVTPTSHAFSGGNVVFGTSPGRAGQVLKTSAGDIPVYNNVREGLDAGHSFNTGVVYLPPSGVRDGVAELVRVNPELRKIVIVTEKIAVHDAREIPGDGAGERRRHHRRQLPRGRGQLEPGADRRGARRRPSGRVADQGVGGDLLELGRLHHDDCAVSRHGRLGHDDARVVAARTSTSTTPARTSPARSQRTTARRRRCSIPSRAATTSTASTGPSRSSPASSAAGNRSSPAPSATPARWRAPATGPRTRNAGSWRRSGSTAIFTPDNPVVSKKGAIVTNIADIPAALTAVMALNGVEPDFAPRGNLALKPWLGNDQGLRLPAEIALPMVTAPEPYAAQIATLGQQVGAVVARQNMKDKSGASVMDPQTQVTSVHGHEVLDLALQPLEACFALPLVHEIAGENDRAMLDVAVAAEVNLVGDPILVAADAARDAGNAPNAVMAAAAAIVGPRARRAGARLHPGADRSLRAFGAPGRAGRRRSTPRRSSWTRRRRRCSWRRRRRRTTRGPRRCWRRSRRAEGSRRS